MRTFFTIITLLLLGIYLDSCSSFDGSQVVPDGFVLHPDFDMTMVAEEPLVFDPVDMEAMPDGTLFVLEMPGYPNRDAQSRLIRLKDLDGDGIYDNRHVFADTLRQATSFLSYEDGFLVAAPPFLLQVSDLDGDGTAETRTRIMEGFSDGNLQHNFNGLTLGLDNWIYATNGGNGGRIVWLANPQDTLRLYGSDFRFNMDRKALERIGRSSGGFEMAFDDWGHIFTTNNIVHISHLVYPNRYFQGMILDPVHTRNNISDHDIEGLARLYPVGVQETRVNHPEQSGFFSGACGITYYGGGNFPSLEGMQFFVPDVVLNLVHRDVVQASGSSFEASRGREGVEFLASTDRYFRPVNMQVGPQGEMYLLDIHRTVIEHPEWIPDEIEKDLDLEAGKEKGRIYRIMDRNGDTVAVQYDVNDVSSLVSALADANQYWRMLAHSELQASDADVSSMLQPLLSDPGISVIQKIHALWILNNRNELTVEGLLSCFQTDQPQLLEQAILVGESYLDEERVTEQIYDLLNQDDKRVLTQTLLTLSLTSGQFWSDARKEALLVRMNQEQDPYLRNAFIICALQGADYFILKLTSLQDLSDHDERLHIIEGLTRNYLASEEHVEVESLLNKMVSMPDIPPQAMHSFLEGSVEGLTDRSTPLQIGSGLQPLFEAVSDWGDNQTKLLVRQLADLLGLKMLPLSPAVMQKLGEMIEDTTITVDERMEALALAGSASRERVIPLAEKMLNLRNPSALQNRALDMLAGLPDNRQAASTLLKAWRQMSPSVRYRASTMLIYEHEVHDLLLDAIDKGLVSVGECNFDLERRRELLWSDQESVRKRARSLFTDAGVVTRSEAIAKMRHALDLAGDLNSGRELFSIHCGTCHRYADQGIAVGPDLTEISRKSAETLLHDILDPNAVVDPEYVQQTIIDKKGTRLDGVIISESDQLITLLQAGGESVSVSRSAIESISASGRSLMPEGFEVTFSPQEMADLLHYLNHGAE